LKNKINDAIELVEKAYEQVFDGLDMAYGTDWKSDPNMIETPKRVAKLLIKERCVGINSEDECDRILSKVFPSKYNGFVITNPITVNSLCPHHFENVEYTITMGYLPKDHCVGLSKIGRVIKLLARSPILQEDLTMKLADIYEKGLKPDGVAVVVTGRHNCMICRGLQEPNVSVVTSEVRGSILTSPMVRDEFYRLCNLQNKS